jgi:hypothetical protein
MARKKGTGGGGATPSASATNTAEMRTLNLEFAFNTGKLDVEGRAKGDSQPWPAALEGDAAANFLRKLCNKMADALAEGNPSVVLKVDRDGHTILAEQ